MKKIEVHVPEGYELDEENSTPTCIRFKPAFGYIDVAKELFKEGSKSYIISERGKVEEANWLDVYSAAGNNCVSERQAEKLLAFNKLMNVAKFLNNGWTPDFKKVREKWFIYIDEGGNLDYGWDEQCCYGYIYFKNKGLAQKAVEILGQETIRLALCADY